MTRVEKYHSYREQIANMKVEDLSSKTLTTQKINKLTEARNNSRLQYDEIMSAYSMFGNNDSSKENKLHYRLNIHQIIYLIIALAIIFGLSVLLIMFGINLWR